MAEHFAGLAAEHSAEQPAEQGIVETTGLRKSYDGLEALRGLDLEVPRGSISGFLGRNGAGKTTTLKVLLGMTHPSAGQARVFGLDAASPRESMRQIALSAATSVGPSRNR